MIARETIRESFGVRAADVEQYQEHGFVVLRQVLGSPLLTHLAELLQHSAAPTDRYQKGFDRLLYDTCVGDESIYALLRDASFRSAMHALTGRELFFTQGTGFSLRRKLSTGLAWHIEAQSFGYQRPEDDAATLWVPMQPIRREGQRGGIRCVSRSVLSGEFAYAQLTPAVFKYIEARLREGDLSVETYAALRDGPLNAEPMRSMLEYHAVEVELEPGDALLMSKYLLHRSVALEDGPLATREAFAFRFIDSASRYDRGGAEQVEIPRRHFGYEGPTRFHLDVCRHSGETIADSPLFAEDREIRCLTRACALRAPRAA